MRGGSIQSLQMAHDLFRAKRLSAHGNPQPNPIPNPPATPHLFTPTTCSHLCHCGDLLQCQCEVR